MQSPYFVSDSHCMLVRDAAPLTESALSATMNWGFGAKLPIEANTLGNLESVTSRPNLSLQNTDKMRRKLFRPEKEVQNARAGADVQNIWLISYILW